MRAEQSADFPHVEAVDAISEDCHTSENNEKSPSSAEKSQDNPAIVENLQNEI